MTVTVLQGDCRDVLDTLPDGRFQTVVTSPPYFGLRDYGHPDQMGLEPTPDEFVAALTEVFRNVRRVLRDDGTVWLNLGDSYAGGGTIGRNDTTPEALARRAEKFGTGTGAGSTVGASGQRPRVASLKPKDLIGIPWRVAFALQADGWYLRQDIIWAKPNPMPESVRDRCTKAHEYVFLLSKGPRYFYDAAAVAEPGVGRETYFGSDAYSGGSGRNDSGSYNASACDTRNRRSVWTIATQPFKGTVESVRRVPVAWDAPVDGKKRTTSPDCPVHGGRPAPASIRSHDAHASDDENRNGHNDDRPVPEQPHGSAPTAPTPDEAIAAGSSGSPLSACSPSAMRRSNQTSRKARAPATGLEDTPSARIAADTGDRSAERAPVAPPARTVESSAASAETVCNGSPRMAARSADSEGELVSFEACGAPPCTCEWYVEQTEKTSHYAVMPPDLAEVCIRAGSKPGDHVLDPFGGAGTTGLVADRWQRHATLIELNPANVEMARERINRDAPLLAMAGDASA